MFLVSMMFTTAVSAVENMKENELVNPCEAIVIKGQDIKDIDDKYAIEKGDGEVLTFSPTKSFSWTATTDMYRYLGIYAPRFYTESISRIDGSAYDIDEIGVRGRIWRDDSLVFDDTDSNSDSADANIYWAFSGIYYSGDWDGRGNHVFEEGNSYWYPITTDSMSC
jgi:hypothetical protein